MAPSVGVTSLGIQATGVSGRHSLLSNLEWFALMWSEEPAPWQESALRHMAETGSKVSVSSSTEGISGRLKQGTSSGNPGKATVEDRQGRGREVNLGERWFIMETSLTERRALFCLEKEMETTLLFEHGGSRRASQLWVTRILLGRLFRERLSLSRVVKSYEKFQQREMMRALVMLNELEEVAETPLGGHPEPSVSRLPRDDPLDMEADNAALEEEEEEA